MKRHLDQIAKMLLADENVDSTDVNWGCVRYAHTSDIRSQLIASGEEYSPSTIKGILSELRDVLKKAWLLEQIPQRITIHHNKIEYGAYCVASRRCIVSHGRLVICP